jgi:hypothetical protein
VLGAQPLADPRRVPPELDRSVPGGHESNIHAPMLGTNGCVARQRHESRVRRSSRSEPDQSSRGPQSRRRRRSTANSLSRQSPQHVGIYPERGPTETGAAAWLARAPGATWPQCRDTPGPLRRSLARFPSSSRSRPSSQVTARPGVRSCPAEVPPAEGRNSSSESCRNGGLPREYCTPVGRACSRPDRGPIGPRESENRTDPAPARTWVHAVSLDARSEGSTREQRV